MSQTQPKILYLSLLKKWFDMTATGEKKIERRQATDYWRGRLLDESVYPFQVKHFDEIEFRNGYGKKVPSMRFKCGPITLRAGVFEIEIGERI